MPGSITLFGTVCAPFPAICALRCHALDNGVDVLSVEVQLRLPSADDAIMSSLVFI